MLSFDKNYSMQHNFDCLEVVCKTWMGHYNFMLGLISNTETDNFFYQEHFNEFKWYDV
jgi:hypothetical protein